MNLCHRVLRSGLAIVWVLGVGVMQAQKPQPLPIPNACVVPNGPTPCKDSDGDGLCDSWELSQRLPGGAPLPGADPNKPDIYLQYDWMGYGLNDRTCQVDSDCTDRPSNAGETCTGPAVPGRSARSCVRACSSDLECTSRGPSHVGDRCIQSLCRHTHDPEILAPGAIQAVVDSFTKHSINLHIVRGQELPHSHVLSFQTLDKLADTCEGGSLASGTAGAGQYAESFYDLKSASFDPRLSAALHYSIFGHYSGCDTFNHCDTPISTGSCPTVKGSRPQFGQSGQAEITGNDFIVSMGRFINELGGTPDIFKLGGTFMHELGHNLGLHHGGGASSTTDFSCLAPDCEDAPSFKPNYLSVMNYRYQTTGILEADIPGSSNFVSRRLDFSNQVLPAGGNTPGALTENGQLNEMAGLGSGTADLFSFDDGTCTFHLFAPTNGPIDWDGDGVAGNNPNATADLNTQDHPASACTVTNQVLRGHADWGPAPGQSIFTYKFQCNPATFADGTEFPARAESEIAPMRELTPEMAQEAHVLYPPRQIKVLLQPGCTNRTIAPGTAGRVVIAILGEEDLDVTEVDLSSLNLHRSKPARTEIRDINFDGRPDLLVEFDMRRMILHPAAKSVRLTGWLKNSQVFVGEDAVTIGTAAVSCR